ncbi:hypothetical protein M5E87_13040 [Flavonifractor plautii]|nr:hypothetical protein M5E87_13040 [Flavonifractor plautii]
MRRTDQWLLGCFAVTMAVYTAAFTAAFSDLPLNIPPWHQLLLLYFHAFPMFFFSCCCAGQGGVAASGASGASGGARGALPERGGLDGHGMVPAPVVVCRAAAGEHWRGWCGQSLCESRAGGWENRPEGAIIGSSEEK